MSAFGLKRTFVASVCHGAQSPLAVLSGVKAGPCGDLTFIAGESGRPLTKESFGNLFRMACREAGLQNRSAHGLRKAAATRAANAGATESELEAIFGWSGGRMASLYTRAANRRHLSKTSDALAGEERAMNKRYPHLEGKPPAPCKNQQRSSAYFFGGGGARTRTLRVSQRIYSPTSRIVIIDEIADWLRIGCTQPRSAFEASSSSVRSLPLGNRWP
jgi:hypothetical protein